MHMLVQAAMQSMTQSQVLANFGFGMTIIKYLHLLKAALIPSGFVLFCMCVCVCFCRFINDVLYVEK